MASRDDRKGGQGPQDPNKSPLHGLGPDRLPSELSTNKPQRDGGPPSRAPAPDVGPAKERPVSGLAGQDSPTGTKDPALPNLSLPKAGGAIRSIGEKFDTNAFTGTSSFSLPIATTPGRGGFGPSLSLSYDSGNGNGPFGLGWALGLPTIRRKTAKGLPQYGPGDSTDVFLLAGAEDLVPRLTQPIKGGDWVREQRVEGDETKGPAWRVTRYVPRTEGSFQRIERWTVVKGDATRAVGTCHWQVTTGENVTMRFGTSPLSRIADPRDPTRIFEWLLDEQRDDRGNIVVYRYRAEDLVGVDAKLTYEANRLAIAKRDKLAQPQRYLERISYGNDKPNIADNWHFEAVFDYGDLGDAWPGWFSDDSSPKNVTQPWPVRVDAFSDYRPGFEVRTWRLCERVLMFHRFTELGPNPVLVSSSEWIHDPDPAGTRITSATQTGYIFDGNGKLVEKAALPALKLKYSEPKLQQTMHTIPAADGKASDRAQLRGGVDGQARRFVDLDGEGIAGILSSDGSAWTYRRNLGEGRFAPAKSVDPAPGRPQLQGDTQLIDLGGDGRTYAVDYQGPTPGYYVRTDDGSWSPHRSFTSLPRIDFASPAQRMMDLNGDGFADILRADAEVFEWYPADEREGFERARRVWKALREADGPRLIFGDSHLGVYVADMSGDGLSDLVRIGNGSVCYWPNLGYGRFGARVTLGDAPVLDDPRRFDQSRVRLADVDGTGTTDLIYLGDGKVTVWFNRSGNSFSEPVVFGQVPPIDSSTTFSVMDLLGNGTACLVWSSGLPNDGAAPLRYVDVLGGVKPYLLTSVDNGRGLTTTVTYKPSTAYYLEDEEAGRPWVTKLPFPVQVVSQVEVVDGIAQTRVVTEYSYSHGCYDHDEREFRGFGLVQQRDTESLPGQFGVGAFTEPPKVDDGVYALAPVLTKTWFHTGVLALHAPLEKAYEREFWAGDDKAWARPRSQVPSGLDGVSEREAWRALRGQPLRQEVYALDGSELEANPYVVTDSAAQAVLVQPRGNNQHAVFLTHPLESRSWHYERNPADPRVSQSLTLEVDAYGVVRKSATIAYPRRAGQLDVLPEQKVGAIAVQLRDVAYELANTGPYHFAVPTRVQSYELRGMSIAPDMQLGAAGVLAAFAGATSVPYAAVFTGDYWNADKPPANAQKRLLNEACSSYYHYDGGAKAWTEAAVGEIGTPLLLCRNYVRAGSADFIKDVFGHDADGKSPAALDLAGLVVEALGADDGFVHVSEALAPGGVADPKSVWWVRSGRAIYDPAAFFVPTSFVSPYGEVGGEPLQTYTVTYDAYSLTVTDVVDPPGNTVSAEIDYRLLQPRATTDINDNRQVARFDALGVLVASAVMGKPGDNVGDKLGTPGTVSDQPTVTVSYDLHAFAIGGLPTWVEVCARQEHYLPGMKSDVPMLRHRSYFDGSGREAMVKTQVAAGDAPVADADGLYTIGAGTGKPVTKYADVRFVGSGKVVFDNKGNPVKQYEPFFSPTIAWDTDQHLAQLGVSPLLRYDPIGRLVRVDFPDGTFGRTEFDPWSQTRWDANDTVLQSKWYQDRLDATAKSGADGTAVTAARIALVASLHANTPTTEHLDALGFSCRVVLRNDPSLAAIGSKDKPALADAAITQLLQGGDVSSLQKLVKAHLSARKLELLTTYARVDVQGRALQITDARGVITQRNVYDQRDALLRQQSPDSGCHWSLSCGDGLPALVADARGIVQSFEYDALRRPVQRWERPAGAATSALVERHLYGEAEPDAKANNLRGQPVLTLDDAGAVRNVGYDFAGNLVQDQRRLRSEPAAAVDWAANDAAAAATTAAGVLGALGTALRPPDEALAQSWTYNALHQPLTATTPDQSVTRNSYDVSGALRRVELRLRGAGTDAQPAFADVVSAIAYDAYGQRERVVYGNGVSSKYSYDPLTLRLVNVWAGSASGKAVQDLRIDYDPVGNVVRRHDAAVPDVTFDGETVTATNRYLYDSQGRLIVATGRQNATNGPPDPKTFPPPPPPNATAVRSYQQRYRYDAIGNLLAVQQLANNAGWTREYAYHTETDADGKLVPFDSRLLATTVGLDTRKYAHDAAGNLTSLGDEATLAYNAHGLLQSVALAGGKSAIYRYDVGGGRVCKRVDSRQTVAVGAWEGSGAVGEDGAWTRDEEFLAISDGVSVVLRVETSIAAAGTSSAQRFELADQVNSRTVYVDGAGGVLGRREYLPYGAIALQSWSGTAGGGGSLRWGFGGKRMDGETGLLDFGARMYAPWLGRWTACDPVVDLLGSAYGYCRGSPVSLVDPDGKVPRWVSTVGEFSLGVVDAGKGAAQGIVALGEGAVHAVRDPGWGSAKAFQVLSRAEAHMAQVSQEHGGGVTGTLHVMADNFYHLSGADVITRSAAAAASGDARGVGRAVGEVAVMVVTAKAGQLAARGTGAVAARAGRAVTARVGATVALTRSGSLFELAVSSSKTGRGLRMSVDLMPKLEPGMAVSYSGGATPVVRVARLGPKATARAIRRQAMRDAGIPTSQQPVSQRSVAAPGNVKAGRQYDYELPAPGGSTQRASVQHSLTDRTAGHGPHWEAGRVKPGGQTDSLGRPRLRSNKAKVDE